jgi:HAD superfamily hydrolase (TIGR01509 family)
LKRAILFDLDGVLIDSMGCHTHAWQQAILTQLNIDLPKSYFYINEGKNSKDIIHEIIEKNNIEVNEDTWQNVSDYRDQLFMDSFSPQLIKGAEELVTLLHDFGYQLGVATGSTRMVAENILSKTGIRSYFSTLVTSEDVQYSKPHPEPYQNLLNLLQSDPEYALVIENAPLGIESALAANLICLAVTTTNSPEVLDKAHKVFTGLDKIGNYLKLEYENSGGLGSWDFYTTLMEKANAS